MRFYAATGTGKYETVGTEVRKYDPAIWELYHGLQPGIESNDVYKGNTRTLWKTLRGPAILMALALIVGVVMLGRLFIADGTTVSGQDQRRCCLAEGRDSGHCPRSRRSACNGGDKGG
ncbi:TPA: hypothetical protein ACKQBZ_000090 [Stenotrophomonas maltophilia]|uniref:hypothetical protein n=1 Tax=Stenotrophomonas TaxID=40323 RepID=UPI0027E409FB|nr:hypothetical protein [Stenotrophomonas sp. Sm6012]MDQ7279404.1 hypothetical protein [Stenotrophomonas sp. Sm6012]